MNYSPSYKTPWPPPRIFESHKLTAMKPPYPLLLKSSLGIGVWHVLRKREELVFHYPPDGEDWGFERYLKTVTIEMRKRKRLICRDDPA